MTQVWDLRTEACVKTLSTGLDVVQCVEFVGSKTNELIVAGGSSRVDEKKYPIEVTTERNHELASQRLMDCMQIWDLGLGTTMTILEGHTGFNWALQYDQPAQRLGKLPFVEKEITSDDEYRLLRYASYRRS